MSNKKMEKYNFEEVIFSSSATTIQVVKRKDDQKKFVFKKSTETFQALTSVESFKKDFQLTSMLHKSYPENFIHMEEMIELNNGAICLVEDLEGISLLKSFQTNGAYSVKDFLGVSVKMTQSLQFAHTKQILHRDVKLANFMLTETGKIKLIDFGISVLVTRKSPSISCTSPTGTLSSIFFFFLILLNFERLYVTRTNRENIKKY